MQEKSRGKRRLPKKLSPPPEKKTRQKKSPQELPHPPGNELTPENFPEKVTEVCKRLVRKGYQKEVEEFISVWRLVAERGEVLRFLDDDGAVTEGGKWMSSLLLWDTYLEKGEQATLKHLPFLLQLDCAFFLGQRWIRELIAHLHREGERKKIERVFFGTGKRGVRSFELVMENHRRDIKIAATVDTLRAKGCGYNQAMRSVAANLGKLDIKERISVAAIRSRYEKLKAGNYSLIKLLSPR